jgi:hypothetical protein
MFLSLDYTWEVLIHSPSFPTVRIVSSMGYLPTLPGTTEGNDGRCWAKSSLLEVILVQAVPGMMISKPFVVKQQNLDL